jgi:hypothetical protein
MAQYWSGASPDTRCSQSRRLAEGQGYHREMLTEGSQPFQGGSNTRLFPSEKFSRRHVGLIGILIPFGSRFLGAPAMFSKLGQLHVGRQLKQHLYELGEGHGVKNNPLFRFYGDYHAIVRSGDMVGNRGQWKSGSEHRFC